ncbi:MAG: hypothetical protein LBP61_07465 [Desulfovibrio sp.]|jgi:hypothetical protein|nr:hypothetical protein [Desulfovibrio sp.]
MTENLAISLPVVQMGHVEKLVEIAQNQPQAQQLATQQGIVQELKKQDIRVAETQKTENRRVREREEEESGGGRRDFSQGQRREEAPAEREPDRGAAWTGCLVDVKV